LSRTEIGLRIRERRRELGYSQQQLAERMGATQPRISAWEKGRREPGYDNLLRLTSALGVTVDWILRGGEVRG
jgi:transcriptional regulator with XRE-family HTH domain